MTGNIGINGSLVYSCGLGLSPGMRKHLGNAVQNEIHDSDMKLESIVGGARNQGKNLALCLWVTFLYGFIGVIKPYYVRDQIFYLFGGCWLSMVGNNDFEKF